MKRKRVERCLIFMSFTDQQCRVKVADRQKCDQDEAITKEKCKEKGCCWQPNTDSAWCFYPLNGSNNFNFLSLFFGLN